MTKEILLVYQDCPFCKERKAWGEEQAAIAKKAGLTIRPVPFVAKEVTDAKLMWKAVKTGIYSYPFFTDGQKFSKTVADFVEEKPVKKAKKRDSRKKKTEVKDGVDAEN